MSKIKQIFDYCKEINNDASHPVRTKYRVSGAGVGDKIKNGANTGKMSIILYVNEKKNIDLLSEEEIIPNTLNIHGIDVTTDVMVLQKAFTLVQNKYCHAENPNIDPVKQHRQKQRPLKGGISSSSGGMLATNGYGEFTDATLGIIVRDRTDGQIVLLSNNHVYGNSIYMPSVEGSYINYLPAEYGVQIKKVLNDVRFLKAVQPGNRHKSRDVYGYLGDGVKASDAFSHIGYPLFHEQSDKSNAPVNPYGSYALSSNAPETTQDVIGKTKRTVLFGDEVPFLDIQSIGFSRTSVDAGIVELSSYDLIDPIESNQILNFTEPGPYKFATEEEIYSLFDETSLNFQSPIFRAGRTLGPLGDEGSEIGSCTLYGNGQLSAAAYGPLIVNTRTGLFNFPESIFIVGDGTINVGQPGDSGTAVFAQLSSTVPSASAWKLIGLLFAGPSTLDYAAISPIHLIQKKLNITPWDGTMPLLSSTTETLTVFDSNIYESNRDSSCFNYKLPHKGQEYTMTNWVIGNTDKIQNSYIRNFRDRVPNSRAIASDNNGTLIACIGKSNRYVDKNTTDDFDIQRVQKDYGYGNYLNASYGVVLKMSDDKIEPQKIIETPWLTGGIARRNDIILIAPGRCYLYNDKPFILTKRSASYLQTVKDGVFSFNRYLTWLNDRAGVNERMLPIGTYTEDSITRPKIDIDNPSGNYEKFITLVNKQFESEPDIGILANDHLLQVVKSQGEDGHLHTINGGIPKFTDNGDLLIPYRESPYTLFARSSGAPFKYTSEWNILDNGLNEISKIITIPDNDSIIKPLISEGVKEYGEGKVVIFDPTNNYRIKQVLKPINKDISLGLDVNYLKKMYKTPAGDTHEYYDNIIYGSAVFGTGDGVLGGGISTYGDYIAITSTEYTGRLSGRQYEFIDIFKHNHSTNLYEPVQVLSSCKGIDVGLVNGAYFLRTAINHTEMNDKYLTTSIAGEGLCGMGQLNIYEKGDDGLFTYKYNLSSPYASDDFNPDIYTPLLSPGCSKVQNFGSVSYFLGKYLFCWGEILTEAIGHTMGVNISGSDQHADKIDGVYNRGIMTSFRNTYMLDSSDNFTLTSVLSTDLLSANDDRFQYDIFVTYHQGPDSDKSGHIRRHSGVKNKIIRQTVLKVLAKNLTGDFNYDEYAYDWFNAPVERHLDVIELIDDIPTITKRYASKRKYYQYSSDTLIKNKDIDYIISSDMSHDNDYLYYTGVSHIGVNFDDEVNSEWKEPIYPLQNAMINRINLNDDRYFKPMTEFGYNGPVKLIANVPSRPTISTDKLGVDRDTPLSAYLSNESWFANEEYKNFTSPEQSPSDQYRALRQIWYDI